MPVIIQSQDPWNGERGRKERWNGLYSNKESEFFFTKTSRDVGMIPPEKYLYGNIYQPVEKYRNKEGYTMTSINPGQHSPASSHIGYAGAISRERTGIIVFCIVHIFASTVLFTQFPLCRMLLLVSHCIRVCKQPLP